MICTECLKFSSADLKANAYAEKAAPLWHFFICTDPKSIKQSKRKAIFRLASERTGKLLVSSCL